MEVWHEDDIPNRPMTLRTIAIAIAGLLLAGLGASGIVAAAWLVIAEMVG